MVKKSLECLSWSICSEPNGVRSLFTCIEKNDLCACGCSGRHTLDAMLEVFLWCMKALLRGKFPSCRHDTSPWRKEDAKRKGQANADLGFCAFLCQNRGDWAWFKQLFGFKGLASNQICWMCEANKSDKPYWDRGPCSVLALSVSMCFMRSTWASLKKSSAVCCLRIWESSSKAKTGSSKWLTCGQS